MTRTFPTTRILNLWTMLLNSHGLIGQRSTAYLKSLGSRLCRAKGKRDRPLCLPAAIWPVAEDIPDMDFVPTRWCPMPCPAAVDAALFLRLDDCDGALCKAAAFIDTYLARSMRPVPPDGSGRDISW